MSARYDVSDLSLFFDHGVKQGATHMFVIYQTTGKTNGRVDRNDCHYFVKQGDDAKTVVTEKLASIVGYKELLEVYNLKMPKEPQLHAHYAYNF